METPIPRPEIINNLRNAADAAFAMLAGMQLDVFTPLKDGPRSAEDIARAIGVGAARLRLLLYPLVAARLLTEENGYFSNSPEANRFLVKGRPDYKGDWHAIFLNRWIRNLKNCRIDPHGCTAGQTRLLQISTGSIGDLPSSHQSAYCRGCRCVVAKIRLRIG